MAAPVARHQLHSLRPDGTCAEQRLEFGVAGSPGIDHTSMDSATRARAQRYNALPAPILPPAGTKPTGKDSLPNAPVRKGPSLF